MPHTDHLAVLECPSCRQPALVLQDGDSEQGAVLRALCHSGVHILLALVLRRSGMGGLLAVPRHQRLRLPHSAWFAASEALCLRRIPEYSDDKYALVLVMASMQLRAESIKMLPGP